MIRCDIHDYVEIACTYNLSILLKMKSGNDIQGVAMDTCLNEDREECLKIKLTDSEMNVVLENVKSIKALTNNPHFDEIKLV